jgi:hypothetical protein
MIGHLTSVSLRVRGIAVLNTFKNTAVWSYVTSSMIPVTVQRMCQVQGHVDPTCSHNYVAWSVSVVATLLRLISLIRKVEGRLTAL